MVNYDQITRDVSKAVKKSKLGGSQELAAGETGRRYEPALGVKKHNERIHKESAQMDKYSNLPFSFSKPNSGNKARPAAVQCDNCGNVLLGNVNTVGIVCRSCNTYSSVTRLEE